MDALSECWPDDALILSGPKCVALLRQHDAAWSFLTQDTAGCRAVAGLLAEKGIQSVVRSGVRGYLHESVYGSSSAAVIA